MSNERRHEALMDDADDYATRLAKQRYQMKEGDLPSLPTEISEATKRDDYVNALEIADALKPSTPVGDWNALIASMAVTAGAYGAADTMRACISHASLIDSAAPWLGLLAVAVVEADDDPTLLASCLDAGVPATHIDLDLEIDLFNYALGNNHPMQMELLLERGANVHSWQSGHHQACGIVVAVQFCRDMEGGDPASVDSNNGNDNDHERDDGTTVLRMMLDRGADIEESDALQMASRDGILVAVRLLVDYGAPLEEVDGSVENRGTALYQAARHGQTRVVEYLISKGARMDCRGQFTHKTPLEVAREEGFTETATVIEKALAYQESEKHGQS